MVVDCLTKAMKPDVIFRLLDSGKLNIRATDESVLLKMRKQKLKQQAKEAKATEPDDE